LSYDLCLDLPNDSFLKVYYRNVICSSLLSCIQ
jgi:hypothetical protein